MSTLGDVPVVSAEVHVPPSGAWFGTVVLSASALPALGATVLALGDLQLVGSVIRADWDDAPNGARVIATVRGGPGWGRPVTRKGDYSSAGGVKLSTVIRDLSSMTGESCAAPAERLIGEGFAWPESTPIAPFRAAHVLADLVWRGYLSTWRVDPSTGQTVWAAWPAIGAADGRGRITGRAGDRGRRTVGLDVQVAAFMPGATLEGVTIARTVFYATADAMRAEVYGS